MASQTLLSKIKEIFFPPKKVKGDWYKEGEEAYFNGSAISSCPYTMSWQKQEWMDGYVGKDGDESSAGGDFDLGKP